MDFQLDRGWTMSPVRGATGKTYIGIKEDHRIFIKQNTTPMLAALSREGITPKLVWTKRTGTGDILTAQEWLDGQELSPEEIGSRNDVIDVLYHLHHSQSLKVMLKRVGGQMMTSEQLLADFEDNLPAQFETMKFLRSVHFYLRSYLPAFHQGQACVVHGDVNHRNWLVCRHYLYLVDWDSIMFADAALDIGTILGHYVPLSRWGKWLISYGMQVSDELLERVHWYAALSVAKEIKRLMQQQDERRVKKEILTLKRFFSG